MFVHVCVCVFGWVWLQEAVVHSGCSEGKGEELEPRRGVSSARRVACALGAATRM